MQMTLTRVAKEVCSSSSVLEWRINTVLQSAVTIESEVSQAGLWQQPSYEEGLQHFCSWWQQGIFFFPLWGRIMSEGWCLKQLVSWQGETEVPFPIDCGGGKKCFNSSCSPVGAMVTAMHNLLPLCQRSASRGTLRAADRCKLFSLPCSLVACKAAGSYVVVAWHWAVTSLLTSQHR